MEDPLGRNYRLVVDEQLIDPALPGRPLTSIRKLRMAVLERATDDLRKYARCTSYHKRALKWVNANDQEWPLSFANICEDLGFDASAVRAQLASLEGSALNGED